MPTASRLLDSCRASTGKPWRVAAHSLGYQLGTALHARNDQLAALWRRCWVAEPAPIAEPAPTTAKPILAPLEHPLAAIAAELAPLTQRELLRVTGLRSRRRSAC